MDIKLHNTLSGEKETFAPIKEGEVKMYNCGPTVYGRQHVGNLSMFVFTDVLRRSLEYFGNKVDQVINITDFGHLTSDADEGEDKMTKGLKAEGLEPTMENMRLLADKFAGIFFSDLRSLNIDTKEIRFPFASEYISKQIEVIKILEEKDFAYKTSDGVYFDTAKFPDYGKLGNVNQGDESRIGENKEKRNQKDFALWKFSNDLGWDSEWGRGFPGWHIECTAMIFALLGEQIDIHTGGIEHIPVHHNNEIAQAEAASGRAPFSRFWLHRDHLKINNEKIAKSLGNVVYLSDLNEKGIHPMSFRYWLLTSHYRTPANFTWEAVQGAQVALEKIVNEYANSESISSADFADFSLQKNTASETLSEFAVAIADDLNTPIAVSLLQKAKSREEVETMDKVLGLNIKKLAEDIQKIPSEIKDLQKQRDEARKSNDWKLSDELRDKIEVAGYVVKDSVLGTIILNTLSNLAKSL
jgi:cysteinyl-tRNA synthetase